MRIQFTCFKKSIFWGLKKFKMIKKALEWWEGLTSEGKSLFPHLNPSPAEILEWYSSPAEYTLPPNISY